jgi:hypothetical protein
MSSDGVASSTMGGIDSAPVEVEVPVSDDNEDNGVLIPFGNQVIGSIRFFISVGRLSFPQFDGFGL